MWGNGASVCLNGNSAYAAVVDDPRYRTMPWVLRRAVWPLH